MAQIAFLTLFLGLTFGPQPVELTVSGPVASVELLLDGAPAGVISGPPWKGKIDLGRFLVPHELVARALDAQGREIGLTRQWVNLARPPAEVNIFLESGPGGRPEMAQLTWRSLTGEKPSSIEVTFDGQPLAVGAGDRVLLPVWNPEESHVLTAELRFFEGLVARKDVVFGGRWGEEISTELTAVPVRLRPGQKLPPLKDMNGWFRAGGRPAATAAVEGGPAELLIVRDLSARGLLGRLAAESKPEHLRVRMSLDKGDTARFIWPVARPAASGTRLFDVSRDFGSRDGGLLWFLSRFAPEEDDPTRQRLADAVAVAGLNALQANHRRAVLLVLSDQVRDLSNYRPQAVRHYLESIRVPLIVWTLGNPSSAIATDWGGAERIASLGHLQRAVSRLKEDLASQQIVWIEGRHLPQSIELSAQAAAVLELVR